MANGAYCVSSTLLSEPRLFALQEAIEGKSGIETKTVSITPFLKEAHLSGAKGRVSAAQDAIRISGTLSVSF
jgi:hypothetical protein